MAGLSPDRSARSAEVLEAARSLVARYAVHASQRELLDSAFAGLDALKGQHGPVFFIELPLLVHAAVAGTDRPPISLAAATTLVFLGADALDDVADGDWHEAWGSRSAAEITLGAATLLSAIAPLAIEGLGAPAERTARMHAILARGLLQMAAGQYADLTGAAARGLGVADRVEVSVAGKSGAEMAMFAALGAELAGASAAVVERYAAMGSAIGTGGQFASDCHELFADREARDLARGAATLPLALHLERLDGAKRRAFLELLERARSDESARVQVRREVRASGALRHCLFIVEVYRHRARRELAAARPHPTAADALCTLIDGISSFSQEPAYARE